MPCANCKRVGHNQITCFNYRCGFVRCGYCNELGHTKAMCTKHALERKTVRTTKCSICKQVGHNKRTCPKIQTAKENYKKQKQFVEKNSQKQRMGLL